MSDPVENNKKRIIIIDSNSVIHRAYHALPPLSLKTGEVVGAVYGFLLVFLKAIKDFNPDFVAACFDFPAPTFRHQKYKQYKAKRPPAPETLYSQIPKVKEFLAAFRVPVFEKEKFEADDIIGTIARLAPKKQAFPKIESIILSGDLDALQLVDEQTKVFALRKGVKDVVLYNEELTKEKFQGLVPDQLLDYKALRGDASDNIPGITGIGEKTTIDLLLRFGSLDNIYREIEKKSEKAGEIKPRAKELLLKYKEQALLSRQLAKIETNVPIEFNLKDCRWGSFDKKKVTDLLESFQFHSLVGRIPEGGKEEKPVGENLKLW